MWREQRVIESEANHVLNVNVLLFVRRFATSKNHAMRLRDKQLTISTELLLQKVDILRYEDYRIVNRMVSTVFHADLRSL